MKVIDDTISLSSYLESVKISDSVRIRRGNQHDGWLRTMYMEESNPMEVKILWWKKILYKILVEFEIWNEDIIVIKDTDWEEIYPEIKDRIKDFEQRTGKRIIIRKVKTLTEFSDY